MCDLSICIPTYKRPLLIEKLLLSLIRCYVDKNIIRNIKVIVVDNDINKSAELVVKGLISRYKEPFSLYYYNYPEKGLANVRNQLLKKALEFNPHYIIFIDDDEYPSQIWINELVYTMIMNDADMVRGPVIPVFNYKVSEKIKLWFERINYEPNERINIISTNNLIIKVESFIRNDVWFDRRFNFTGAEDAFWGRQMLRKGAKIHWAANAVVYEHISPQRATLKYLIGRRFRGATNYIFQLKLEKEYIWIVKKTLISIFYMIIGFITILLIILPVKWKYWGLFKMSEGIGGIAGLLSYRPEGY